MKNKKTVVNGDEDFLTAIEKQVREIIDKFRIKVNRDLMKEEIKKGFNKCKDNNLAFFEYKLGKLFPRNEDDSDPVAKDLERKKQM